MRAFKRAFSSRRVLNSVSAVSASGDVIAEIETDKATMEVEAVDAGVLGKILVPAGTETTPVVWLTDDATEGGDRMEPL